MSKRKPWTVADDAKLVALSNAGESWKDIAEALGRSVNSCKARAKRPTSPIALSEKGSHIRRMRQYENMGHLRKTNVRTKKDTIALIVPLIQSGLTTHEIANEIGITKRHLISYYYKDAKAVACPNKKLTDQIIQRMVAFRKGGMPLRQIGTHFCICMETVRQVLLKIDKNPQEASEESLSEMFFIRREAGNALPAGHPIAMKGLWCGLEHYRVPGFKNVVRV